MVSGARLGLSPKDEEVKRRLVRCHPWSYSELIRSDISGPSGAKPAQLPTLRSSPPSVMKPSLPPVSRSSSSFALEPLIPKPTLGELRASLEVLAKKKRSVKRKTQASPKGCPPVRGKILKAGVSSSPSSTVGAGDSSRREAESPFVGSSYFGLESYIAGRRAPFSNARLHGKGSLRCCGG